MKKSLNTIVAVSAICIPLAYAVTPYGMDPKRFPQPPDVYSYDSNDNFFKEMEDMEREYQIKLKQEEIERRMKELERRSGIIW